MEPGHGSLGAGGRHWVSAGLGAGRRALVRPREFCESVPQGTLNSLMGRALGSLWVEL